MNIELKEITIRDLAKNYTNNNDGGCFGYDGKLDIRPKYQREFVYKNEQRDAVINTVTRNFPLNVMYWIDNDGMYEVLDGQQRTISICEYVVGNFSYKNMYFHNLTDFERDKILDYKIMVYFCKGTDKEKLDWFKTINISGEKLTDQELRNAVYTGEWLSDAKRYFSKNNCPAYDRANKYMSGNTLRQDYLETAIKWISNGKITEYMSQNQQKSNANELWLYFSNVITWIETVFKNYRKEMKGLNFGLLYNTYKDIEHDSEKIEKEISRLMMDDEIKNKKGIYYYVLTRKEKHLNIRSFSAAQKRVVYEKQNGKCNVCNKPFNIDEMEADHIIAWVNGGKTEIENCQLLCMADNREKSKN